MSTARRPRLLQSKKGLQDSRKDSSYRNRSVEENLELFKEMKNGEILAREKVLRVKIDMNAKNMLMRDPLMVKLVSSDLGWTLLLVVHFF